MVPVVILSAARTPIGTFQGSLAGVPAPQLGAVAIRAALERAGVGPDAVSDVAMGNVLQAGLGQAPARQAALGAGVSSAARAVTVHKVCGSGLQAVIQSAHAISAGDAGISVAGGMENMSAAPYLAPGARAGYRLGDVKLVDSLVHDGLWDPYNNIHMGSCAEQCARKYGFSRDDQDAYAIESFRRANAARDDGRFAAEIAPVRTKDGRGADVAVDRDEGPGRVDYAKLPKLRPVFDPAGTVTAGNASSINDGAAALVLAAEAEATSRRLRPVARLVAFGGHAQDPLWFTTAPATAARLALQRAGWEAGEVDLWEVNEAFAVVPLAFMRELGVPHEKMNVRGGAIALGHPIGCSGARILVTLLAALEERKLRRGMAAICIGGGEALAACVERIT